MKAIIAHTEKSFLQTQALLPEGLSCVWISSYDEFINFIAKNRNAGDNDFIYAPDYQKSRLFKHPKMQHLVQTNLRLVKAQRQKELLKWWKSLSEEERRSRRQKLKEKRNEANEIQRMNKLSNWLDSALTGGS